MINFSYLTILKFSFGIIFSISFFGAGKSTLFIKKISAKIITRPIIDLIIIAIVIKLTLGLIVVLGIVFFVNSLDFPAPKKEIEKIIPNENFKIVK